MTTLKLKAKYEKSVNRLVAMDLRIIKLESMLNDIKKTRELLKSLCVYKLIAVEDAIAKEGK